jgi:Tol biopolymer transport system component/DNA-binding winged helix-turn-helix (wHTH) protein
VATSPTSAGIICFGKFEADLRSRELRRNGARVRLPDQAFLVLAILLERPGELVTREEIQKELWPSDTFVDFDHGLNNAVNRLREALGDSAEMPQFVETLPRRGYRFLATVKWRSLRTEPPGNIPAAAEPTGMIQSSRIAGHEANSLLRKPLFWIVTAMVAVALLIAVKSANTPLPPASRSYVLPPEGATFNLINDDGGAVVLSPDGRKLAFVAVGSNGPAQIWIRTLAKLSADPLEGSEDATFPFWSPDGQWIAFFAEGKLKKIRIAGGAPITICDAPFGRGGSWKNGVIIFAPASHAGIYKVADSGGSPVQLTTVDPSIHTTHRWPKFLPDGRHFLYLAASHFRDAAHDGLYMGSIDGGSQRLLVASEGDGTYVSGFLFFYSKGMLQMQRFNPEAGQLRGEPRPTGEKVLYDSSIWKVVFDASESVMAYQLGEKVGGTQLRWFDRSGKELGSVGTPVFQWEVHLSPDGKKIAIGIGEGGYSNLWVYDLLRHVRTPITFTKFDHGSPIWSVDGKQLIFASKRKYYTIATIEASGGGSEQPLFDAGTDSWPFDLSKDGRYLLYGQGINVGRSKSQLWVYPTKGDGSPYRLLEGDSVETDGQFSPDGRWVAYVSNLAGREEVYVVPFRAHSSSPHEAVTERVQVSLAGGRAPRWRRDGKEIFYLASDKTLMSVRITHRGAKLDLGVAHALFRINLGYYIFPYDVSPDGKRFIVNTATPEKAAPITLVENWQSDFK